jgi:hypothetical protein
MKKGQVAMESLMVYGITLLIVGLAIGALIYFGVLDLGGMLPDKCTITGAEFDCDAFIIRRVASGAVSMEVTNKMGENLQSLQLASCVTADPNDAGLLQGGCNLPVSLGTSPILNGQKASTSTFTCNVNPSFKAGEKIRLLCRITFQTVGSSLTRSAQAEIVTSVQN